MRCFKKLWQKLPGYIAYTRKAIINVSGLIVSLLALGLLPDKYAALGATIAAIATAITHYLTPNADSPVAEDDPDI